MNTNDYSQTLNSTNTEVSDHTTILDAAFDTATGSIPFNMTNDYMFRAVLQSSPEALKGLLCSLLHLAESEVASVEITNPILLGEAIDNKEFYLDINLLLNDSVRINLEMQIVNQSNWENRSVMYLCRTYDDLNRGQDYRDAKPAVHIGFLDYTLFADRPEFYAAYKLVNVKSHHVYNDNLTLYVADLTRIDLATEEDRRYHIDSWAKLFKAKTWEEIKMIADEDKALYEAAKTLFYNSSDEEIRLRCLAREEYWQDVRYYQRTITETKQALAEEKQTSAKKDLVIAEQKQALAETEQAFDMDRQNYEKIIAQLREELAERKK